MTPPFDLLYADPPWAFRTWSKAGEGKAPQRHYPCLPTEAIAGFAVEGVPISKLAARDALLFLWIYQPMLPDAFAVMEAWGFSYVTVGYVWVKTPQPSLRDTAPVRMGLGRYTRAGHEQCWIGKRGDGLKRVSASEPQVIFAPIREHSRKPDAIPASIERLHGPMRRLEIFARETRLGWTVTGNETAKFGEKAA